MLLIIFLRIVTQESGKCDVQKLNISKNTEFLPPHHSSEGVALYNLSLLYNKLHFLIYFIITSRLTYTSSLFYKSLFNYLFGPYLTFSLPVVGRLL